MGIYGFPNEDRTEIVSEFDNDDLSEKQLPTGEWGSKFPIQKIIAAGGISYNPPPVGDYERLGDIYTIGIDSYTRNVVSWAQDEIAADLARIEHEEIRLLKLASPYLLALVGRDNIWIDNKIDNSLPHSGNATLDGVIDNIRSLHKEQAYTSRDIADLFTALYKLGRI